MCLLTRKECRESQAVENEFDTNNKIRMKDWFGRAYTS